MALYTPITSITQAAQNAVLVSSNQLSTTPSSTGSSGTSPIYSTESSLAIALSSSSIGTNGFILRTPGYYQLSESIIYTKSQSPLIVASSHVVIDLNGQTLQYAGPQSSSLHAIVIAPGSTNVSVQNGTIAGFPGAGIAASGTINNPIKCLTIQNLKILECYHGILNEAVNSLLISNCTTVENLNPIHTTCGIEVSDSSGIVIQQCTSQNNKSPVSSCYGYILTNCKNTVLVNCSASGNEGMLETAGIYFGDMVRNNYIQNCASNGNCSKSDNAYGIVLNNSNKTHIQDSITQGNVTESVTSYSYGIQLKCSSHTLVKHNSIDKNDYGIYDNEPTGQHTNIFTQNSACQNKISDYLRPYSSPLPFIKVQQEHLQGILLAGSLDNISIRINS